MLARMNDLSSDDSTASEFSARKRVPPKKRPMQLLNVFSSDSSDSEDDDDEVRTLSGSQPLSIGSLGSPTFGTQEEHSGKKFLKLSKVAAPVFPRKQPEPQSKPKTANPTNTVEESKHDIVRALAPKISLEYSMENKGNSSASTAVDLTMTPDRDTGTSCKKKKVPVVAKSCGESSFKTADAEPPKPRTNGSKKSKTHRNQSVLVQATKTTDQKAPGPSKAKAVKRITATLSKAAYDSAEKSEATDIKEPTSKPNAAKSLTAPQYEPLQVPREGFPTRKKVEGASNQSKGKKMDKATSQSIDHGAEPPKQAKSSQREENDDSNAARTKTTISAKTKMGRESADAKENAIGAKGQKTSTAEKKTKPAPSKAAKTSTSKQVLEKSRPNKRVAANSKPSAPAAKKSKKMSFQDQIVNKLFWSFKPFTVRSLCDELKATENTVEFCMLSLVDKGVAVKKDFTSAKGRVKTLYWANHDTKSKEVSVGTETTAAERHETKQQVQDLQSQEAHLNQQLAVTLQQPSNADLSSSLALAEGALKEATQMVRAMKDRINAHKQTANSKKRPFSACSKHDCSPRGMKARINHMRHEWVKRKAKCRDFVELLADGMEKKPKDVIKLLDIETDESCDAAVPPKHQID